MSNRESKIAESKAALCYGFAIALRALFLGILPYSPSLAEGAGGGSLRASVTNAATNRVRSQNHGDSVPFDCNAHAHNDAAIRSTQHNKQNLKFYQFNTYLSNYRI
ncbi:MAG: hypothetical protein K2N69_00065 [Helicobacter sp.]|nr:hypothetical protein [Helicobacter sp.]